MAKKVEPAEVEKSMETVEKPVKTPKKSTKKVEKPVEKEEKVPEKSVYEVVGCHKLNIRERPTIDSPVVQMLSRGEEIVVEDENTPGEFFKVCTAFGIEGYCMKLYLHKK